MSDPIGKPEGHYLLCGCWHACQTPSDADQMKARIDLLERIYATLQNSKAMAFVEFDAKGTDFKLGELMDKMSKLSATHSISAEQPRCVTHNRVHCEMCNWGMYATPVSTS